MWGAQTNQARKLSVPETTIRAIREKHVRNMPPEDVQIVTTFSAGVCTAANVPDAAQELLVFMASPAAEAAKRRHGMDPA